MKTSFSNTEILFIRACKSRNPMKRVVSVYKRFYFAHAPLSQNYQAIASILASVADKHFPIKATEMLYSLSPCNVLYTDTEMTYGFVALHTMVYHFRFARRDQLPEYPVPAFIRNIIN